MTTTVAATPPALGVAPAGRVGEERPHLVDPGPGERLVVLAGEGAHQGDPLHAEEVGERVLVDRAGGHPRIVRPGRAGRNRVSRALGAARGAGNG